jgi:Domain of unknown function (DUF4893)
MRVSTMILLSALLLPGCATLGRHGSAAEVAAEQPRRPEWLGLAESDDLDRLARLGRAWDEALAELRAAGLAGRIAREEELLDPDAALPRPEPPPGSYRCRLLELGRHGRSARVLTAHAAYFCHVGDAGELLAFTQQTGPERPGGYLYPDAGQARLVFLGALALGRESVRGYGEARERDAAGVVERVASFRWRLVLPWPRSGAKLEVMELVPALP